MRRRSNYRELKPRKPNGYALCPLCNERHAVFGSYWLIPSSSRVNSRDEIHEGVQTEFWCDIEGEHVVKQYSHEFKYIGYYRADEIPF